MTDDLRGGFWPGMTGGLCSLCYLDLVRGDAGQADPDHPECVAAWPEEPPAVNTQPVCPGRRTVGVQDLACTEPPGHRGPHSAPGTPPLVGAAWCDVPCRGRRCAGPCHPDDPGPARAGTRSERKDQP